MAADLTCCSPWGRRVGHDWAKSWLSGKDPDAGKDWRQEEKGTTEDEMVGWHHRFDGHGFGWTLGAGDGQGGLACRGSWGHKVGHNWATELNWATKLNYTPSSQSVWKVKCVNQKWRQTLSSYQVHFSVSGKMLGHFTGALRNTQKVFHPPYTTAERKGHSFGLCW